MTSSFIPQRIKRATQQITVELYKDQLAMLDNHGRFIDDSPDYIISQALELVFRRDKEFTRWIDQEKSSCSNLARGLRESFGQNWRDAGMFRVPIDGEKRRVWGPR